MHPVPTPDVGGIAMFIGVLVAVVAASLINDFDSLFQDSTEIVGVVVACAIIFVLGLLDDIRDISPPAKVAGIVVAAIALVWFGVTMFQFRVPFLDVFVLSDDWVPLVTVLWLLGMTQAINLIDGLDGLAILPTVMVGGALGIFCYLSGNVKFAEYLFIPYVPGAGELIVFCAALVGAGLGFLWFNTYPAQVFMGDVGALALGAALGTIAVIVRQEVVLFIMGGIFVVETLSVIIQVASFKLTGKRVFRMAPIHHHFELKGWPEPRVIVRFWIITVILVLIGLATLKLR